MKQRFEYIVSIIATFANLLGARFIPSSSSSSHPPHPHLLLLIVVIVVTVVGGGQAFYLLFKQKTSKDALLVMANEEEIVLLLLVDLVDRVVAANVAEDRFNSRQKGELRRYSQEEEEVEEEPKVEVQDAKEDVNQADDAEDAVEKGREQGAGDMAFPTSSKSSKRGKESQRKRMRYMDPREIRYEQRPTTPTFGLDPLQPQNFTRGPRLVGLSRRQPIKPLHPNLVIPVQQPETYYSDSGSSDCSDYENDRYGNDCIKQVYVEE